jgi:hypothetical protein
MSNPESEILFPYEYDKFDPLDQTRIEDLDPRWIELTEQNFGENDENREKLTKVLEEKIRSEGLEESVKVTSS